MDTLKQLQDETEYIISEIEDGFTETGLPPKYQIKLTQLITLAFEAGKAEAIAMVLKEIEKQKSEYNYETQDDWDGYRYAKYEVEEFLKTKLTAKE